MDSEIVLKNKEYSILVSLLGAQLLSFKKGDKEYIWQRDERYWKRSAPILFPVCGAFRDEIYLYGNEKYPFPKHGFALTKMFEVFEQTNNSITLVTKETEETLKTFPFKFSLYIKYTLNEGSLVIDYKVVNEDSRTMYFAIGAHEGYALEDDFNNYSIKFEEGEKLISNDVEGLLLGKTTKDLTKFGNILPLDYEYFKVDALVFRHIKSREVTLLHNGKEEVTVSFPNSNNLLIWTKPDGKYICIEPWSKSPDFVDSVYEVSQKEDIISLESGSCYIFNHTIRIK